MIKQMSIQISSASASSSVGGAKSDPNEKALIEKLQKVC